MNTVNMLALGLKQYFCLFTMLSVEGSYQLGLFRHLSNDIFRGAYFWKHISYEGHLFLQMLKI